MALPASYDFAGTGALSASWSTGFGGGGDRISDQGRGVSGASENVFFWSGDSFNNDQYCQVVIPIVALASGVIVRWTAGVGGYLFAGNNGIIYRLSSAMGYTTLQSTGVLASNGDTLKITVEGTTIKAYKNGVQAGTNQTDSNYTGGAAGLYTYFNAPRFDDFLADNIGGASNYFSPIGIPSPVY